MGYNYRHSISNSHAGCTSSGLSKWQGGDRARAKGRYPRLAGAVQQLPGGMELHTRRHSLAPSQTFPTVPHMPGSADVYAQGSRCRTQGRPWVPIETLRRRAVLARCGTPLRNRRRLLVALRSLMWVPIENTDAEHCYHREDKHLRFSAENLRSAASFPWCAPDGRTWVTIENTETQSSGRHKRNSAEKQAVAC